MKRCLIGGLLLSLWTLSVGVSDAQSWRGYDRFGRDFRLHGNGFGRGTGGIYSGTRAKPYKNFNFYGSPFVYTPYVVAPYAYDPTFVSPGYYGGYVDPYNPYTVPGVAPAPGYFYGYDITYPTAPPVTYVPPPVTETPVDYRVANSKDDAQRLREMFRNQGPGGTGFVTARPVTFRESTPEQQLKSVREEQIGDKNFAEGNYLLAYTRYKNAIDAAEDRAEPRAKLAVAYASIGQYDRAAEAVKTLLQLDPDYPQHFLSLDSLYGERNLVKEAVKTSVAEWTSKNVSDPDRLLLLGAMMYFDGDIDRSRQLFDTVTLYDDLKPLVQGFLAGRPSPVTTPATDDSEPLEIPNADIPDDFTLPPLP